MSEHHFDAEILGTGRVGIEERVYGDVRVRAESRGLHVIDERVNADARDIPAFVELFFHDVYLLLNIASPGSFSGVVSVSGGDYRVNELAFDARVFEYARRSLDTLPLRDVAAWYDSLQIGTRQIATNGVTKVLFHLLHLARSVEDDEMTVIRLAQCLDALELPIGKIGELRDAIVRGTAPALHPMADDALDPAVDDVDWTDAIDDAASRVIGALQARVRRG